MRIQKRCLSTMFEVGDMVIVRECSRNSGKTSLLGPLQKDKIQGTRKGNLHHQDILGQLPRTRIPAHQSTGTIEGQFIVHSPTLEEYILMNDRKCTPIYPKDASAILSMLDIDTAEDQRILEAGTGNAGLTMRLANAVGPNGTVYTVERHENTSRHAQMLVERFRRGRLAPRIRFYQGELSGTVDQIAAEIDPRVEETLREIKEQETGEELWRGGNQIAPLFDGVVLDMPTPWDQLPHVFTYLKVDRYIICYLPNMSQIMELVRHCKPWPLLVEDVVEVDWRQWEVRTTTVRSSQDTDAMVCRPTHQPVGHTAFLVKLRKL